MKHRAVVLKELGIVSIVPQGKAFYGSIQKEHDRHMPIKGIWPAPVQFGKQRCAASTQVGNVQCHHLFHIRFIQRDDASGVRYRPAPPKAFVKWCGYCLHVRRGSLKFVHVLVDSKSQGLGQLPNRTVNQWHGPRIKAADSALAGLGDDGIEQPPGHPLSPRRRNHMDITDPSRVLRRILADSNSADDAPGQRIHGNSKPG